MEFVWVRESKGLVKSSNRLWESIEVSIQSCASRVSWIQIQMILVCSHTCFYPAKIMFLIPLCFFKPLDPDVEGLHGLWLIQENRKIHQKIKVLVKLWWLKMCFVLLTVGSVSILKPYTHPATAQSCNTQTKNK